jgi:hypothetical protein
MAGFGAAGEFTASDSLPSAESDASDSPVALILIASSEPPATGLSVWAEAEASVVAVLALKGPDGVTPPKGGDALDRLLGVGLKENEAAGLDPNDVPDTDPDAAEKPKTEVEGEEEPKEGQVTLVLAPKDADEAKGEDAAEGVGAAGAAEKPKPEVEGREEPKEGPVIAVFAPKDPTDEDVAEGAKTEVEKEPKEEPVTPVFAPKDPDTAEVAADAPEKPKREVEGREEPKEGPVIAVLAPKAVDGAKGKDAAAAGAAEMPENGFKGLGEEPNPPNPLDGLKGEAGAAEEPENEERGLGKDADGAKSPSDGDALGRLFGVELRENDGAGVDPNTGKAVKLKPEVD